MFENPFEITKAVDFTDAEIQQTYVDFPSAGAHSIADPASAMAQFLVGGKGGGRTHLMRYYSYPLQKQRSENLLSQLQHDGYLGIYFRCSGLNGSRFQGKGESDEAWSSVFCYYMDVWLTEHLLNVLIDINETTSWDEQSQVRFANEVLAFVDSQDLTVPNIRLDSPLAQTRERIVALRSSMDRAVNNAALRKRLDIDIKSNPGELLFAANSAAERHLSGLSGLKFTYLVDEFENLSASQQIYVNTLLREKELPTSFLVGSRIWGVRTHETLSAAEVNRENSEYRWVVLENAYRQEKSSYVEFCERLATSRLRRSTGRMIELELAEVFGSEPDDKFDTSRLMSFVGRETSEDRPHMQRLRKSLLIASGDAKTVDRMLTELAVPTNPLLEKMALRRFYQAWSEHGELQVSTAISARQFAESMTEHSPPTSAANNFKLWKTDLRDQLYVEHNRRVPYQGFSQFIEMSGYLPRSFLTILKYVAYWAEFNGEAPFRSRNQISPDSQVAGVLDASRWFSVDALPSGSDGRDCDRAIRRLGSLLRRIRFSDKPTEVGSVAFSTDFQDVSERAAYFLDQCIQHTLIVEIADGRTARNAGSQIRKFQLHPMLAPTYSLPTARRGEISLQANEVTAIFDPSATEEAFSRVAKRRLAVLNAPFTVRVDSQDQLF